MADDTDTLEALSQVISNISENPFDLSLHVEHIQLAQACGLEDQADAARLLMTRYWAASDDVWLPLLDSRLQQEHSSSEEYIEILGLFRKAEEDYLSIPVLQRHIRFLIDKHNSFLEDSGEEESATDTFSTAWTRSMLAVVVEKGSRHLTQGHLLWDARLEWELEQLERSQGEGRRGLILDIEDMILERLKQPHSNHEQTFQAYSTFTTTYKPPNLYETLLVSASKLKAQAVKAYNRRERNEAALAQSNYSASAYDRYLNYERNQKNVDSPMILMLYERAISDTARARSQDIDNGEVALRAFWSSYCDTLRSKSSDIELQRSVFQRVVRSVPGSGLVWSRYLYFVENFEADSLLQRATDLYERALATRSIQREVEDIVLLVTSMAGLLRRLVVSNEDGANVVDLLIHVLENGIDMVHEVSKQGDSRYRIEKLLADFYTQYHQSMESASNVWKNAAEHYKTSYLPWLRYLETLMTLDRHDEARSIYSGLDFKKIDWPEAIIDSWLSFEQLHGDLEQTYECIDKVERVQAQINAKRYKEAANAAYATSQAATQAVVDTSSEQNPSNSTELQMNDAMEIDIADPRKRKHEEAEREATGSKKPKTEQHPNTLKRDRENCTVFVSDLPSTAGEKDIKALFKDCGEIREVKLVNASEPRMASVEFFDRDNIPAALTRDKKRIDNHDIAVYLAWQSTIYVTNFPEKADDAFIRELFEPYGTLMDVRWPSKKFKATRRFCYVQFSAPSAAQAALALHEREIETGIPLQVFISNPERKKDRTDANANNKEIYVAGLSKFVTEKELEKLFKNYGTVREIRMPTDESGHSKGYAFIEFEEEASASLALQANNQDLKNRRIAVTMADTRVRARRKVTASGLSRDADTKNRSVRIRGLSSSAQEGLLQQVIEKVVRVKRLEVFQDLGEAIVELENAAEAGKLLLSEPILFEGTVLQFSEETIDRSTKRPAEKPGRTSGAGFVPRAVQKPRAGLGMKKAINKTASLRNVRDSLGDEKPKDSSTKSQDDFRKLLG